MFNYVYPCLLVYLCFQLFNYVYPCILIFTYVYPCILVFIYVYSCTFKYVRPSLLMFINVNTWLPMFKVDSSEFYFHKPITVHIELYLFYRFIHFLLYIGQY